ncbi:MAG: hypothetical protein KIH01_05150 [Candidatus Freyarchaeota archaeon]|nr:hypothetical protein [Candidatus Jordarchaeia archaeon]
MGFLEERVSAAIQEYNRYHAPEAVAELVQVSESRFCVFFSGGSLCRSCGVYDYFDDLRVLLEDFGLRTRIEGFEEGGDGIFVVFVIEKE